jgi:hypothetical protein
LRRALAEQAGPTAAAESLDAETLALVFAAGVEQLYVLSLDRQRGLQVLPLGESPERIEDQVREIVRGLEPSESSRRGRQVRRDVDELSRVLLGPLGDRLDAYRRLLIVADGPLEELPFEVLRHPRSGRHLVASHEVAYLPSFSVLAAARARKCSPAERELFALGDPIFGRRDERWSGADDPRHDDESLWFRRLPASAAEVEGIARLYVDDASSARAPPPWSPASGGSPTSLRPSSWSRFIAT